MTVREIVNQLSLPHSCNYTFDRTIYKSTKLCFMKNTNHPSYFLLVLGFLVTSWLNAGSGPVLPVVCSPNIGWSNGPPGPHAGLEERYKTIRATQGMRKSVRGDPGKSLLVLRNKGQTRAVNGSPGLNSGSVEIHYPFSKAPPEGDITGTLFTNLKNQIS